MVSAGATNKYGNSIINSSENHIELTKFSKHYNTTGDFEEEVKSDDREAMTGLTTECSKIQTDGKFKLK